MKTSILPFDRKTDLARAAPKGTAPTWAFVDPAAVEPLRNLVGPRDDCLLFAAYLLRSALDQDALDQGLQHVRVPREIINECRRLKSNAGGTGEWLAGFCEQFGTRFVEYINSERVRRVDVSFLAPLRRPPRADARRAFVHVVDGLPVGRYELPEKIPFVHEDQRSIKRYFAQLSPKLFEPSAEDFDRARGLSQGPQDDVLLQMCAFPGGPPVYWAAKSGNTVRLFADGWSNLRKEMRRTLMPHWVELDLTACHFAVLERVAAEHRISTPAMTALLDLPGDTWTNACAAFCVGAEHRDTIKALVTPAIYGAGLKTLQSRLNELPAEVLGRPLPAEVRAVNRALGAFALEHKFLRGVGHRKVHLTGDGVDPLLHNVCSGYELSLVAPVYDVARGWACRGCHVTLHQHDGVAVTGPVQWVPAFVAACAAEVARRAEALRIRTRLVTKTSLPAAPLPVALAA